MPESSTSTLKRSGLEPVPYVIVKRPDGSLALRHPDELQAQPPAPAPAQK